MRRGYDYRVGIFMPAYNQGKYIDEALDSLRRQTFQDFFIHIVDDGSTDGETSQKLKTIEYEKAKVFLNRQNKGVAYRARQHYARMNAEYILVLCADDKLEPTFLEKTVKYMEEHPRCGAVGVDMVLFYDDKRNPETVVHFSEKFTTGYVAGNGSILGSSLMRKKALDETDLSGGFVRYQDWDRWLSMLEAGWMIESIPEPLFYYRQHADSLYYSATIEEEMAVRYKMLKKHSKIYREDYEQIFLTMSKNLLVTQKGKKWLEQQYFSLNKEIDRLNGVIDELNEARVKLEKENNHLSEKLKEMENFSEQTRAQSGIISVVKTKIKKVFSRKK